MLHDSDIREPLFDFLEEYYGRVRIIEEKNMGRSRADVVMVTEHDIYGIEIKSDADTYARLDRQVKDYDRYFDYNIVVVGTSHALHIREHVPLYWGIVTVELVDDKYDFYYMRQPMNNPKVLWKNKLELMWRPELAAIQEMNLMPKYKEKSKAFVVDKIIERIPDLIQEQTIKKQVSNLLFERDYTTIADELDEYRRATRPTRKKRRTKKSYSRR
ncbi:MAG: sce7726 family protein [Wujia sp.]